MRAKQPVVLYQTDLKWCKEPYTNKKMNDKKQTIGSSGCGIVSTTMLLDTFFGFNLLPPEIAKLSVENGFRTDSDGTSWAFYPWISKKYNLKLAQTNDINLVKTSLKQDALIICSMTRRSKEQRGYFTSSGHFILLWGLDKNGKYYVNDPIAWSRTNIPVEEDIFINECKQYFIFYKPSLVLKIINAITPTKVTLKMTVIVSELNIREYPFNTPNVKILGVLKKGTVVEINSLVGGWANINYLGEKAYICADPKYLK